MVLAAIGDIYFQRNNTKKHECFDKAKGIWARVISFLFIKVNFLEMGKKKTDIFADMKSICVTQLGECCFRNRDGNTLKWLNFEGREIFEPDEDGNDDGKNILII